MIIAEDTASGIVLKGPGKRNDDILEKYEKIKPINKTSLIIKLTLIVLAVLTVYSFICFDYKDVNIFKAVSSTVTNFATMLGEPHFKHFDLGQALYQIIFTLGIAFLATLTGGILAFFFGLFAAQNLSSKKVSNIIKGFVSFIRAVPTVLWVLIFAVAAGLGSTAAVVGMTFHSFGYLLKAYSESFEELDRGVIEALMGSGANWWQIVFQAVLPSSVIYLLSWTFIRFEINFVEAVAVGAAAGAGGIGFELFMASAHYFDLREVGFITYMILAIAMIMEITSNKMKIRLKEN